MNFISTNKKESIFFYKKTESFKIFLYLWIFILPWDFTKGIMGSFSIVMFIWWVLIGKKRGYLIKLLTFSNRHPILGLIK